MAETLAGKTILMSGGSRGIGLAIALGAARDGANVVLLARTGDPHPKLEGTVHTAAAEIEAAGGRAVPVVLTRNSRACTGNFYINEDVLRKRVSPISPATGSAAARTT